MVVNYSNNLASGFLTAFAFFCRSTIWERRWVISSCCRAASSVFFANSSEILAIWMFASPLRKVIKINFTTCKKSKQKHALSEHYLIQQNPSSTYSTILLKKNKNNTKQYDTKPEWHKVFMSQRRLYFPLTFSVQNYSAFEKDLAYSQKFLLHITGQLEILLFSLYKWLG